MITDEFTLKLFFYEMLKLGVLDLIKTRRNIGFSCDNLMKEMCIRQDPLLDRMINDYSGDDHEYCLNNAGLKLYWKMEKDKEGRRKWLCSIGGDQARDYPWFVPAVNTLIRSYGCSKIIKWREVKRSER